MYLRKGGKPGCKPSAPQELSSSHSASSQHLGQGPDACGMWESRVGAEELKSPCAQRTCLVPKDPSISKQGLVSREKREIGRAGQRQLDSCQGVQPERREEATGPAGLH